jgi:hypothetical protein
MTGGILDEDRTCVLSPPNLKAFCGVAQIMIS